MSDTDEIDTDEALFDEINAANPGLDERQLREFCVKWTAARHAIAAVRTGAASGTLATEHLDAATAAMQEGLRLAELLELDEPPRHH